MSISSALSSRLPFSAEQQNKNFINYKSSCYVQFSAKMFIGVGDLRPGKKKKISL